MKHSKSKRAQGARRGGFTRVEAIAAVAVAGALSALVMPASAQGTILDLIFGRARLNQSTPSCQSNLKQLGLGLLQYQQDYDERSPLATIGGDSYGWANAIQPYVKSVALFQCPAEKHVKGENEGTDVTGFKKAGFTDYWLNRNTSGRGMTEFDQPTQSISMGDGDGGSALSTARYNIAALPQNWIDTRRSPARRHVRSGVEGANYAFLDGHVKWYTPDKISVAASANAAGNPTFSIK